MLNKKLSTTVCLCLTTKCKSGLPTHVHINNMNIVTRESDICAEHVKTIDQCRLEQYLGNVGNEFMEQVDRALVTSLGIKDVELSEIEPPQEPSASERQLETVSMFQFMGQQLRFWQDIEVKFLL